MTMTRMIKFLPVCIGFCILALAACETFEPSQKNILPDLTFSHMPPVQVDVQTLLSSPDDPAPVAPAVPHGFVVTPDALWQDYTAQRFQAVGSSGLLYVLLESYSIEQDRKESDYSWGQFLNVDGLDEYKIEMTVHLLWKDELSGEAKGQRFTVQRVTTISEHASPIEREQKQFEVMEELFQKIDANILDVLKQNFDVIAGL